MSSPSRSPARGELLLAAVIFVAASIAMTWPLVRNLDRAVADPGDPLITVWMLDWDWWATLHQPLSLFHANTFYPARYSLAFSENLYGIALFLFPLRLFGVGPVAAQNLAILAGFAFCGIGAFLLGRKLTGSFAAALAAGMFYAFVPFRLVHLGHVQHIWGGWLPLLLVSLLAYAERPGRRTAALFGAVFVMNGLTNIHYLFFGTFAAGVTALLLIPRRQWRDLAIATFVALLLLAPFLYPYLAASKLYGMQRGAEEVWRFSAMPRDWIFDNTEPELRLAPGVLPLCVGALAFLLARRQKAKLALATLWLAIGFAGSLGLHFVFHEFLFGAVPGFRAIRAPARWAVIAYIGLAMLIALFTAAVARWNRWVALIVPMVFAGVLWKGPVRWYLLDPRTPPVYTWLAQQKVQAIAELPIDSLGSDYAWMLYATVHRQKLINGISGFAPPMRQELSRLANETPIPDAFVDTLKRIGVELVIVHPDRYGERGAEVRSWLRREVDRGRVHLVAHFDALTSYDWVFSLRGPASPPPDAASIHEMDVYLYGGVNCTSSIGGVLETAENGRFSGWASSSAGIRSVDLWFNNRQTKRRARLVPLPPQRCAGQPPVRFEAVFPSRPAGIWRDTDVQVEVTDGAGRKAVFDDRWIEWR